MGDPVPAELHARREGSGPKVVLLHGLAGDHTVWNAVLPTLAEGHDLLAPDLRGHGRSPLPPNSTMSFGELSRDVLARLDREGFDSAHLVGMSAGGMLALRLAVEHPDRFRSLTLIGSAGHCDRHTRGIGERWGEVYRDDGLDALAVRFLKDLYYPDWIEAHMEVVDHLHEALQGRDLTGVFQWGTAISSFDIRPRLGTLRLPTVAVQGMDDQVVDPSHARLLRQTIRGSEVRLLAQTGHMVPVERPAETIEAIRGWVGRTEASSRS
jgi:pimeloyl-ACP methyl ester carboxylesterase